MMIKRNLPSSALHATFGDLLWTLNIVYKSVNEFFRLKSHGIAPGSDFRKSDFTKAPLLRRKI